MGQNNIETNGLCARQRRAAIAGFHDARAAAGPDRKAVLRQSLGDSNGALVILIFVCCANALKECVERMF